MYTTPKTLSQLSTLALDVYKKLIARYHDDGQRFIDDEIGEEGLILPCVGSVALLLLANNFEEIGKDDQWESIVRKEFDKVETHIQTKGYDATPFVGEKLTERLFSKSADNYYTDSLSWILSLTTQFRVAIYRSSILTADADFAERVHTLMKDSLEKIRDAACDVGGWGFCKGCAAPHLYYSFALTEALADFGDYILGETYEIFGKRSKEEAEDSDLMKFLGGDLIQKINEKRKITLEYLFKNYVPRLGENEIEPIEVAATPGLNKHLLLYYTYFVIEMIVTCNVPGFHPEWDEPLDQATELAIYLSRLDLNRAIKDETLLAGGKTWWDDASESTLKITDWLAYAPASLRDNVPERDSLAKLREPGLVPLALRCNAQYAYYIAKAKDPFMSRLFSILLEDRDEKKGLWDTKFYNLLITERAIEGIVDYYDYLSKYEKEVDVTLAPESKLDLALRELLRDEVRAHLGASPPPATPPLGSPLSEGAVLTEELLVKKLTSTLATANAYGKGSDGTNLPVARKDIERLQENFRAFLSNLLYSTLAEVHSEEPEKLRTGVHANVQDLWGELAPWIATSEKLKLGNLFSHLANEALKNIESGKPSTKTKSS